MNIYSQCFFHPGSSSLNYSHIQTVWATDAGLDMKENLNTVEPRSNRPALNGIPPLTDSNSWSPQSIFFYFLNWL